MQQRYSLRRKVCSCAGTRNREQIETVLGRYFRVFFPWRTIFTDVMNRENPLLVVNNRLSFRNRGDS